MPVQSENIQHLTPGTDPRLVRQRLESMFATVPRPVGIHEPRFDARAVALATECITSGWVSSAGAFVNRFEQGLQDFCGVPHAIAVVNGTAALHASFNLIDLEPGDEVLMPSLTFVATPNAAAYCGAIPHFVDVDEATLGVDPQRLDDYLADLCESGPRGPLNRHTGRPVRCLAVMHCLGHPVDLDAVAGVCARYGITLIEDAAEGLGTLYKGHHVGGYGRLSVLSFNGNKLLTTGGGGAILTADPDLARRARHLTTTARVDDPKVLAHDDIGFNYRMPNLNAAIGLAQLETVESAIEAKRRLADYYADRLSGISGLRVIREPPFARSNYWLNALLLDEADPDLLGRLLDETHEAGFVTRPVWTPMHHLPMYRSCPRMDLHATDDLHQRILCLPSSSWLAPACAQPPLSRGA